MAINQHDEPIRFTGRRVENLGANVDVWNDQTGNAVSHKDLCTSHALRLDQNPHAYDGVLFADSGDPQGDDGWGGDVEHPNYDDGEYRCAVCGALLGGW